MSVALWSGFDWLTGSEVVQKLDCCLGSQVLVVVVVDLRHWGISASSQALDLSQCEHLVLGRLTWLDLQVRLDCLENFGRSAAAKHAGSRSAKLNVELANGLANEPEEVAE